MSEDKKNKIVLKTDEKVATSLSVSRGGSLFADSIQEAAESLILSTSLKHAITDFSSLSTRISEVCGAVSDLQALTTPLSSKVLWGQLDKAKSSLANVVLGNNWQNKIDSDSFASIGKLSEICASSSLWPSDKAVFPNDLSRVYITPTLSALGTLEQRTSLLAKDYGISHITSVASQISTITGLFSKQAISVKELIAPSTMMSDLENLALNTHKSFLDSGSVSEWQLGLVDSGSYLVDRQVNWASQLCKTVYEEKPISYLEGLDIASPNLNFISWLPIDLEVEKKKKQDIKPNEALEKSTLYRLSEKGKRLINKIVTINQLCERSKKKPIFNYSGATMNAAATMGGTYCSTKEALGEIIDGLYMLFYENLEHIKEYVPDGAVRSDEVFQCIFRVKNIRTDYRHDNNHGDENKIRKKEMDIGESYSFLYKTQNRQYRHTDILKDLRDKDEYIFYGHSLNGMDYSYFKSLFNLLASTNLSTPRLTIITKNEDDEDRFKNFLRKEYVSLPALYSNSIPTFILTDEIYNKNESELKKAQELFERLKAM